MQNFRGGQTKARLNRVSAALESQVRRTQNLAIFGTKFGGGIPCGYGINYVDGQTYRIYVGQRTSSNPCSNSNRNYSNGTDDIYEDIKLIDAGIVFKNSFNDLFFEPPDPTVYINNSRTPGSSVTMEVCLEDDQTKCKILTVDLIGRIIIQ